MPISQDEKKTSKELRFIQKCEIVAGFFQIQQLPTNVFSPVNHKIIFAQHSQIYLVVFKPSEESRKKNTQLEYSLEKAEK